VLDDRAGVGLALARLLRQQGGSCRLIHLDDLNDQGGALTWATPDDLVEPFAAVVSELLRDRERRLRGIVDLWPLDIKTAGIDVGNLRIAQQIVAGGSIALFKAADAIRDQMAVAARIWLVSRNAVAALPDDRSTECASAALWGLGRTAALEYPQLWGGLIDLEQSEQVSIERDAALLHREIVQGDGEDQIALRAGHRLGARLVRASLPEPAKTMWEPAGAYLITGGLGALGFEVAKWLVTQCGVKHVVLASRRGEEDPNAGSVRAKLETLGAYVVVEKLDVTIDDQVRELIGRVHRPGRPLKGVFHCAGILEDGILGQMDWSKFERVIAPKVFGGWLLHEHTKRLKLDHFVLFSSVLSLMGSAGQANYAAANAFLDALGAQRRIEHLPAIVLNFGPLADSGLATLSGDKGRAIWRARGTAYIPIATAMNAIEALVAGDMSHAAITITQWDKFLQQFSARP